MTDQASSSCPSGKSNDSVKGRKVDMKYQTPEQSSTHLTKPSNCHLKDNSGEQSILQQHRLSYLVLNLYSIDEGYSIGLRRFKSKEVLETIRLPYKENDLLQFIDNEELPPTLCDIFDNFSDKQDSPLFHNGSVFMEIRDYRKNSSKKEPFYESSFVRLKPTNQTVFNDVTRITSYFSHTKNWTQEEKIVLEAKLVNDISEPLRLDPSPSVAIITNRLQHKRKQRKSQRNIESFITNNPQLELKKIAKFESLPAPKGLELYDFLAKRKDRKSISARLNKKIDCESNRWSQVDPLDPKLVEIEKFARKLEPASLRNDSSMTKVDEYIMEFFNSEGRHSMTCVSIFHRSIDDSYFGQLFIDKKRDSIFKSTDSCLFRLGHKSMVEKYIAQFKNILTENGRKPVKITHKKPNQPPKVTCSTNPVNINSRYENVDLEVREPLNKKPKILQSHPKNG